MTTTKTAAPDQTATPPTTGDNTRIGDLSANTRHVTGALAALEIHEVSVDELAACLDLSEAEVAVSVDALLAAGWLTNGKDGRYTLAATPNTVIDTTPDKPHEGVDPQTVRRRFVEHVWAGVEQARRVLAVDQPHPWLGDSTNHVVAPVHCAEPFAGPADAVTWLADHRPSMVAAVQLGAENSLVNLAAGLAAAVWEVAPKVENSASDAPGAEGLDWWRELSRWGEQAAIGWQNPPFFAALVDYSARVWRRAEEYRAAEGQWMRALQVARKTKDYSIAVPVLESMNELYKACGRPHRELDTLFDLLYWHQRAEHALHAACVRARIGSTMLAGDRDDAAVTYLWQAAREIEALGPTAEREHAHAAIELGRALWRLGEFGPARRRFSDALAILVDPDPDAADVVRELLRTDNGTPLPTALLASSSVELPPLPDSSARGATG